MITLITTVDVHSSCLYAGVDDINFAVKDRQHRPASTTHVTSSPTLARSPAALEAVDRGRGAPTAMPWPAGLSHAARPAPCDRLKKSTKVSHSLHPQLEYTENSLVLEFSLLSSEFSCLMNLLEVN